MSKTVSSYDMSTIFIIRKPHNIVTIVGPYLEMYIYICIYINLRELWSPWTLSSINMVLKIVMLSKKC